MVWRACSRWRLRKHDVHDINCLFWDPASVAPRRRDSECSACKDFGYPERRRMQEDFARAARSLSSVMSPSIPSGEPDA
jgi:hypothetical protein